MAALIHPDTHLDHSLPAVEGVAEALQQEAVPRLLRRLETNEMDQQLKAKSTQFNMRPASERIISQEFSLRPFSCA